MKKNRRYLFAVITTVATFAGARPAIADERFFTYSYETDLLPKDAWEYEQWMTLQSGHETGDFSEWNFRSEVETGLTDNLSGALHLNFEQEREALPDEEEESEFKFEGLGGELIYQILNPNLDPVGLALYGEAVTDGESYEFEGKILASKPVDQFVFAFNAIYEAEWERENRQTEEEATLEFTFGAAYKITPQWSVGLEARNKQAYPDGVNLSGQEFNAWNLGPNIHYGAPKWWATLTVLPQIWGNGDGSEGSRQLVHEEEVEIRLIAGLLF